MEAYATWLHTMRGVILVDVDRWLSPGNRFWWYMKFPGEGTQNIRLDSIHTINRADWVTAELVAAAIRPIWGPGTGTKTVSQAPETPATSPTTPSTTTSPTTAPSTTVPSTSTTSTTSTTTTTPPAP